MQTDIYITRLAETFNIQKDAIQATWLKQGDLYTKIAQLTGLDRQHVKQRAYMCMYSPGPTKFKQLFNRPEAIPPKAIT